MRKVKARKKKRRITSVVFRGKRLPAGFVGAWRMEHAGPLKPHEVVHLFPYVLEACGEPPYNLTLEVR